MSINKMIDQIVEAFIPEMTKISKTNESEEQKNGIIRLGCAPPCKDLPMT